MKHKMALALLLTVVVGVGLAVEFPMVWIHFSSDTLPAREGDVFFLIQRCWDTKESMEGKVVVLAEHYTPQDPAFNGYDAIAYCSYKVIDDAWDGCEHNPEQNHTIAIDYKNYTAFLYWQAACKNVSTRDWVAYGNTLEWVNAKDVVGYFVWGFANQPSYISGEPDWLSVLPWILIPAIVGVLVIILVFYLQGRRLDSRGDRE